MHWHIHRGDMDLYGIEDGHRFAEPTAVFPDAPPSVWSDHPERLVDGRFRLSFGCFLISSGEDLVMVDTGTGPNVPDGLVGGQMPSTLAAIGVRPEDIGHVVLTHLHFDHYGGLRLATGEAYFPDARIWVGATELDHWMRLEDERGEAVRSTMQPFVDEGRVSPLSGDESVVDGVGVMSTPGHTPGHLAVDIRTGENRIVLAGDVTHHPFQVTHPEVSIVFDSDPEQAAATRRRFFEDLGAETRFAAGHYPRPGYGRIASIDGHSVFVMEEPS